MKKVFLLSLLMVATVAMAGAKPRSKADLIAASQTGSKASFFEMDAQKDYDIDVKGFSNPNEFIVRRGLPNFFRKCESGSEIRVAYIGGSITRSEDMYRRQTANYIAELYPKCKMYGINAGIAGTGSDLGVCRTGEQVLKYNPDLLIIEFAVNGADEKGVEGIIRQAIKHNPELDILLVHTVYRGQAEEYTEGKVPFNIKRLEKVAEYYNLPSVHMGMWTGYLIKDNKVVWSGNPDASKNGGKIAFSRDGVHPLEAGGNYYTAAVARALNVMKKNTGTEKLTLPEPLNPMQMERATMLNPKDLGMDSTWDVITCRDDKRFNTFQYWFDEIYDGTSESNPIKFKFKGCKIGVFDIGAEDGAAIDIFIDGKKLICSKYAPGAGKKMLETSLIDPKDPTYSSTRFSKMCVLGWSRGQFILFPIDEGVHEVEIRVCEPSRLDKRTISELSDEKYAQKAKMLEQQKLHLGRILIEGEIVK